MTIRTIALLGSLACWMAGQGVAQVTLDRLNQEMDRAADAMTPFRLILQDENPVKARAAMRLLITEGDAAQRQLAISHGFESTDPEIRLEAVRAILDARPILLFRWTPGEGDVGNRYNRSVQHFSGDYEVGQNARVPIEVGAFSEEEACWTRVVDGLCLARINAGELDFIFFDGWSQFELDREGRLVGEPNIGGGRVTAIADLTR